MREVHPYFHCIFVPVGCTGQIQIADEDTNCPLMSYFAAEHTQHMVKKTQAELRTGVKPADVQFDIKTSVVAPLAMKWLYSAHATIVHTDSVLNTLRSVGYLCVFDKDFQMRSMIRVPESLPNWEENGAHLEDDDDGTAHQDQAIDVDEEDMLDAMYDPMQVDALDATQVATQVAFFGARKPLALDRDEEWTH